MLLYLAIVAIFILIVVTAILAVLNYNEKVLGSLISIALIGTATTFVAIFSTLKETSYEKSITTFIVVNESDELPAHVPSIANENSLDSRTDEYISIFNSNKNAKQEVQNIPNKLYLDLLQFSIFKKIIELHYQRETIHQDSTGVFSNLYPRFELTERDNIPLSKFHNLLSDNSFCPKQNSDYYLSYTCSLLPKNSIIKFENSHSPIPQNKIIISKKNYFNIQIIIKPSISTGSNSVPPGITLDPSISKNCKTFIYSISMKATFEKLTSGNIKTEEYKKWAEWLFDEIANKYADNNRTK